MNIHVFVSMHLLQSRVLKKAQPKPASENASNCATLRMFSGLYITTKKVLAEDSGVKPKNINCINPRQDADYNQAVLQANWQVQLSADKAITSVVLAPSLLKSASNPLRFWSISMFLTPSSYSAHLKNAILPPFGIFFLFKNECCMNSIKRQLKNLPIACEWKRKCEPTDTQ